MRALKILHLSADFPDPLAPGKTRAVSSLLDLVPKHVNAVYSLNRVRSGGPIAAHPFSRPGERPESGPLHRAITYPGLPYGLGMATSLRRLARWIIADLAARRMVPDLIHAHKLSVEGLVGQRIAQHFGVPLIVSSQGNSDLKILRAKPALRPAWRRIWRGSDCILPFAPWTANALEAMLGPRAGPVHILPCPTAADQILAPRMTGPIVRTAFRLDEHRIKDAATLIKACALAAKAFPALRLEIAGSGSPEGFAAVTAMLGPYRTMARLVGPVPHDQMQAFWQGAVCLAMPSRRESYGMVFAEALMSGCPVIHGRGSGIEGYFPNALFAQSAEAGNAEDLACRIAQTVRSQTLIKGLLEQAQTRGQFHALQRQQIATLYGQVLDGAVRPAVIAETSNDPIRPAASAGRAA